MKIFRRRTCYRCGGRARRSYMGLDYCRICREVVEAMAHLIPTGPPVGFPGAPGGEHPDRRGGSK